MKKLARRWTPEAETKPAERKDKPRPLPRSWREDIAKAVEVMRKGGVIVYPTDTIWGIGCDATNEEAVRRVFQIKRRNEAKALITLVDTDAKIPFYVRAVPGIAWDLIDFATRPLTIIYDNARGLAPSLIAEDGSAAIRMTQEPFSKELCFRFQKAIVSTSANISGEAAPTCFADISEEILQSVDYVVCARREERGKRQPSSIVKLTEKGEVTIIRE